MKKAIFALLLYGLTSNPAHSRFPIPTESQLKACPRKTSKKTETVKSKTTMDCSDGETTVRFVSFDNQGEVEFVNERGVGKGSLFKAYSTYYKNLSADQKNNLLSPNDPELVVSYFKAKSDEGFRIAPDTEMQRPRPKIVRSLDFDGSGNEILRIIKTTQTNRTCSEMRYPNGISVRLCDRKTSGGFVHDEYFCEEESSGKNIRLKWENSSPSGGVVTEMSVNSTVVVKKKWATQDEADAAINEEFKKDFREMTNQVRLWPAVRVCFEKYLADDHPHPNASIAKAEQIQGWFNAIPNPKEKIETDQAVQKQVTPDSESVTPIKSLGGKKAR